MGKKPFLLWAALITLGAFVVREWFVLTMWVPEPNQGDVGAYLRYAVHMVVDGTFSSAEGPAVPDAFRSPGYPAILALLYPGNWTDGTWFARVYQFQAVAGALTVAATIALARTWLSRPWSLLCGVLMAVQAHNVAATGAVLTEVTFGLCLVAGLLASAYGRGAWAGVSLAFGYLVNPVAALLPFVIAKRTRATWIACGIMLLVIGGWSARNALVDAQGGRAGMNFVQGSWRHYHDAQKLPGLYSDTNQKIAAEVALIGRDPKAGLEAVGSRLWTYRAEAASWYVSKPFLLWDWDIRMGQGQHYQIDQRNTITHHGIGLAVTALEWTLNPLVFALAFCGIVLGLLRGGPERIVALSVLYLTAVHVVLQAEPRYSTAYRSLEFLLAVSALSYLWNALSAGERVAAYSPAAQRA